MPLFTVGMPVSRGDQRAAISVRADTVVKMAGKPVHPGVATLVQELRIGVPNGADEYMFGDVADIAIGRDGAIVVLDAKMPAVREYTAAGAYVRTFGRKGQGPGEYLRPGGIGVHPDGRVMLADGGNWRVNVYSPTGAPVAHWPIPSGEKAGVTSSLRRALLVDTKGQVVIRRPAPGLTNDAVLLRLRGDGTVLDTLKRPDELPNGPYVTAAAAHSGALMYLAFYPQPIWQWSPLGYLVTALPKSYAVDLRIPGLNPASGGATGSRAASARDWNSSMPVVSIRRDVKPLRATAAERRTWHDAVEKAMRSYDASWTWQGPDVGEIKPMFDDVVVGRDGRIWVRLPTDWPYGLPSPTLAEVRRTAAAATAVAKAAGRSLPPRNGPSEPIEYDVFEPDGTYLGQVETPAFVSTFVRTGDLVYGVTYDDDEIPYVMRFRIAWKQQ
jgi:hypothetical protein